MGVGQDMRKKGREMTLAERLMCLRAIDLIIMNYIPSLGDGAYGREPHTLEVWGRIRNEIQKVKED